MRSAVLSLLLINAILICHPNNASAEPQLVFGLSEYVYIEELGVRYKAKIDTGAESASINAINAKVEKGKGKKDDLVHFDLVLPDNTLKSVTLPLSKHIRIKRRASDYGEDEKDYTRRPVLELTLCVGGQSHLVEVNLADRRQFSKPMLVGSEPLTAFGALVDPSKKYLLDKSLCSKKADAKEHNE
ncbi:MAG: RimK/LysX family protein [Zhongshania sp.]|uniref:ATP-dependent zinc protease family protein n=1 Tax=Zhongshania sp. TaxID=1971902 RepID=UPI002638E98B|nr:RimK/LysX family protein [Zhongshania sp.]MDF1692529.1 RimK/LysX family protein [Zhongshania sp.]